jgi:hypothetical protein
VRLKYQKCFRLASTLRLLEKKIKYLVVWNFVESCLIGWGIACPDGSLATGSRNPPTQTAAPTMLGLGKMLLNLWHKLWRRVPKMPSRPTVFWFSTDL